MPDWLELTDVTGHKSSLQSDGDLVRVVGVIPHGQVYSREEMVRFAKALLNQFEPEALTEGSRG